jgi:hypothetical protein
MNAKTREAACSCGQLRVHVEGDPLRVSMCHCLACQRRTGSVFGVQARFAASGVRITGNASEYVRTADSGKRIRFHFCPHCGSTVYYRFEGNDEIVAVPVGAFADPGFAQPAFSVWEARQHPWVAVPDGVEHMS